MKRTYLIGSLVAFIAIISCTPQRPSPRQRILEFVRLIQADSTANILPYIDLDSVAIYEFQDAKYDSLTIDQKKQRLVDGFVGDGEYRGVWSKSQIVVNEEFVLDDSTANVEVSFIERSSRIQYYSQMRLKFRSGNWIITSFQSGSAPQL